MDHNQKYILAIDQSTSGTKALLVNSEGAVIARSGMAHKQHFPQPGWVEHDPLEIYDNVIKWPVACWSKPASTQRSWLP